MDRIEVGKLGREWTDLNWSKTMLQDQNCTLSAGQRILSVQNGLKSSPMSHVSKRRFDWTLYLLLHKFLMNVYMLKDYCYYKNIHCTIITCTNMINGKCCWIFITHFSIYILIDSFKDWTAKSWNNVTVVIFKLKQWYFFAFLTFLTVCFLCVLCRKYVPQCLMYQRAHD